MMCHHVLVAHMWFDLEVQVALGPHLADVSMIHTMNTLG